MPVSLIEQASLNTGIIGSSQLASGRIFASTALPAGSVLQVQHSLFQGSFSTTSHGGPGSGPATAGTDTPLSVTINPILTTSRILVTCNGTAGYNSGQQVCLLSIRRTGPGTVFSPAATGLGSLVGWSNSIYIAGDMMVNFNLDWLDTPTYPSGLTSLTYTLRITGNNNNTAAVGLNLANVGSYASWGSTSRITVYEIAT